MILLKSQATPKYRVMSDIARQQKQLLDMLQCCQIQETGTVHLYILATTHGLQGKIVCLKGLSDGVLHCHLDIVSVLIRRESETQSRPGLINLLQGFLDDELLLGAINNLATCINIVVQPKLQQVSQIELAVHDEVLARGLQVQQECFTGKKR